MSDGRDLVLPAFEMDCRDWLVVGPDEAGMPENIAGAPVLAVLSTVLVEEDLAEATGALTVGILDGAEHLDIRAISPGAAAYEFVEDDATPGTRRYVMPAPGEFGLALLAEFVVGVHHEELDRRVECLMQSFRWQKAG